MNDFGEGVCAVLCCAKSLQSSQTLQDTMDCCPPGSSVLGFLQTRILKWTSTNMKWLKSHFILRGRGSSQPRIEPVSLTRAGGFFTTRTT